MFIDTGMILQLALRRSGMFAPMNARSAMFRSSGARRIFLNLYSINISSLWDEELCRTLTSSYITPEKQTLLVCCKGQQKQEQSTKFKVLRSKSKTKSGAVTTTARRRGATIPSFRPCSDVRILRE